MFICLYRKAKLNSECLISTHILYINFFLSTHHVQKVSRSIKFSTKGVEILKEAGTRWKVMTIVVYSFEVDVKTPNY